MTKPTINGNPKKKRGRPATGRGEGVLVRLQPGELAALDAWIAQQGRPVTRPEAIRAMLDTVLVVVAKDPSEEPRRSEKTAAKAKELAAKAIDRLVDPAAPADEQDRRKRRLLKGPEEFREVRVDRTSASAKAKGPHR